MEVLKNIHHQRGEVMIAQGILPFRYEAEGTECGMTALAGLPAYLELGMGCGLSDSIRRHMKGWAERRGEERQGRKERKRAVPSPSVVFRYLDAFSNPLEEAKRGVGHAYIPAPNKHLMSLGRVNRDLLRFAQRKSPQQEATLDQDGTLVFTTKADALWSYKGDKAYQPLTTYWVEQDMVAHSEFRDGNVPAAFGDLRGPGG